MDQYLNLESLCLMYWISMKTFYNLKNKSWIKIKIQREWKKVFYNVKDFHKIMEESNYAYKPKNIDNIEKINLEKGDNLEEQTTENTRDKQINKDNLTDYNNLYIEQLKIQIDELKKEKEDNKLEKKEEISKYEKKLNTLQDLLDIEKTKAERIFFISDRYEKMINSKNELLLNFFTLTKNIQEWSEVSLNDIKLLLSQHINSEILKIDQNSWDIEFKSVNNPTYFKEIQTIDPNIKIEKSRRGELIALEKRNTVSKWIIIFLFIFLIITIFYFFNLKNLDLSLYMYNTNIRT